MRIKKQHLKGVLFVYSVLPRRKKVLKTASYRKLKSGWKVIISQRDENGKLRQTSTLQRFKTVRNLIKKYFDGVKIQNVTRTDYQQFLNQIGQKYAKSTMRLITTTIKSCVKSAIVDEVITKDFTQRTEAVYNRDRGLNVDYLTVEEIKRLVETIKNSLNPKHPIPYMILTAIYTGMRLGEIAALEWLDIDFDKQTISITKSWSPAIYSTKAPKNDSSNRTIAVNKFLLSTLLQLKNNSHDMVFKSANGMPFSGSANASLRSFLKKADINKPGYHFHSLRHSHVAYLLSKNVDLYAISQRLGHKYITTTAKVYAYLIDEYKEREDQKIIKAIDEIQKTTERTTT